MTNTSQARVGQAIESLYSVVSPINGALQKNQIGMA